MRIAITGSTGFVGTHLASALRAEGHELTLIARRTGVDTNDVDALTKTLANVDAVAHCAGINRELYAGHYLDIHLRGTENVIAACKTNNVRKLVFVSYYNARPNCGSLYHESKWQAEEIVRNSGMDYTILKPGMMFGRGDHMLGHTSNLLKKMPVFGTVGITEKPCYPLAIEDFFDITTTALLTDRLHNMSLALRGPDALTLSQCVRMIAKVMNKPVLILPMPIASQFALAHTLERVMSVPLVTVAQIAMLSEGFDESYGPNDNLPADLLPKTHFTEQAIRLGMGL